MKLAAIILTTLTATSAFAGPAPWQYHKIRGYDAAAESQSPSPTRQLVADLVSKYNRRFDASGVNFIDKSDSASRAFKAYQGARITKLKQSGRVELLFTANMKAASERFDFFAVTDENTDLVAIMFARQKERKPISESILLIRPVQALTNGQTIQDAFDETAFYLEAPSSVDSRVGGQIALKYATNVSFIGRRPKLKDRIFQEKKFEVAKVNGKWVARNAQGLIARFDVSGGKTGGVSVTTANK